MTPGPHTTPRGTAPTPRLTAPTSRLATPVPRVTAPTPRTTSPSEAPHPRTTPHLATPHPRTTPRTTAPHPRTTALDRPARGRGAGLFAPDTITWRLHCDPLIGIAGLRALLLHVLHPVTMAALDTHASHRWDPWRWLAGTAKYIGVTTYGTTAEAMLAGSRLRAVHARISGTTEQGRPYTAEDPALLAWVHSCLVASFLEIVTRGGLSLTPQEQDRYIAEQVRAAMLVGLEPDQVPHDRASLVRYFRQMRPTLAVTPGAQAAVLTVVSTPANTLDAGPAAPARPAWASVAGLAFATLPPWARRLYALPELPGAAGLGDSAATVALRALRNTLTDSSSAVATSRDSLGGQRQGRRPAE